MQTDTLACREGLFVGASSAVNCVAAAQYAQSLEPGSRVVTILCDSGTRHLSRFWKEAGEIGGEDASGCELKEILEAK